MPSGLKKTRPARPRLAGLLGVVALSALPGASAQAQSAPVAPSQAQPPGTYHFNIPAKSLAAAIADVGAVSGWRIAYPFTLPSDVTSRPVEGLMTPQQAMARLLAGTGLGYRMSGRQSIVLTDMRQEGNSVAVNVPGALTLDTIDVQGASNPLSTMTPMPAYAGGQVATGGAVGLLGNRSVMDTPFNQTSYTSKTIQDQQARTITDVLANDPSVRQATSAGGATDPFYIRGFYVSNNDIALNGLYGIAPFTTVSTDFVERVEVLKGPSALLNGMPLGGSIGGTINLVPKRAGAEPLTQFTTSYVSRGQFGEHVDVARRFGPDNACGARFNGTYTAGNTPIDDNKDRIGAAVLGLDCRSNPVRFSADFGYQTRTTDGVTRFVLVAPGVQVPAAPKASANFMPPWNSLENSDVFGLIQAEANLTKDWTAYGAFGAHSVNQHLYYVQPTIINLRGDFTGYTLSGSQFERNVTAEAGLRGAVDTGPINHALDFNATDLQSIFGDQYIDGPKISSNIYTPAALAYPGIASPDPLKASDTRLSSLGVADTLSILEKRIQVTLGVRRQEVGVDSFSTTTGAETSSYDKGAWSPAFTFVIKPWQNVSLYGNYIQGLQEGAVVPAGYTNAGSVLPPYISRQLEAGVKVDWGTLTTTLSAFQITQPNLITAAGTPLPTESLNGQQRNRGIELENFGELTTGVRLLGGITFIDGRQTETQARTDNGKKAIGVPDIQLNLGAEWDAPFVKGFTVTGRMIYTSSEYVDASNTQILPDWTRIDLGARYTFTGPWNKPVTVRFDVQNILDKSYWGTNYLGYIGLGAPRTFLLSTTMNF